MPCVLSVLLASAIAFLTVPDDWFTILVAAVVTAAQLFVLRALAGPLPLGSIVILVFNAVAVLGQLFYRDIAHVAAVSAILPSDEDTYQAAMVIFAIASLAFWCGNIIGTIGVKRVVVRAAAPRRSQKLDVSRLGVGKVLALGSTPLVLGAAGLSIHGLLSRPHYLQSYGPDVFSKIGSALLPLGLASTTLLLLTRRAAPRAAGFLLLACYVTYLFAKGSRALALVPIIVYGVSILIKDGSVAGRRIQPFLAMVAAGATLFFLNLPLALRTGDAGLIPYASRIGERPSVLWPDNLLAPIGNILFSVPLTGHIASEGALIPRSYFYTAINPLPGSLTGWSDIQRELRVDVYTPFNTLGELALHGMPFLIGYFMIAGFVGMRLEVHARRGAFVQQLVARVALASFLALFSLSVLQYNLRSSTRILWYAVIAVWLLQAITRRRFDGFDEASRATRDVGTARRG
jgi:hypothetical protein